MVDLRMFSSRHAEKQLMLLKLLLQLPFFHAFFVFKRFLYLDNDNTDFVPQPEGGNILSGNGK